MGLFSPQTLEQVAAANDIVEVIGSYVPLKRAGSTWKALCPFHREKSPSFTVNPQRQAFKCFGCGAGGSVFRFIMQFENLEFPAAVRRLAERAGVPIVEEEGGGDGADDGGRGELRRRLLRLHAEAADWFHRNLMRKEFAAHAREYLKKRGLSAEVAAAWKIGYAPAGFDGLREWALGQGYRMDELIASGLVKFKDDTDRRRPPYDRFRDRLIFSICNEIGEVIAFSGRILSAEEGTAKYLNSPETPLFTKGKVLFGLHKTKRAILDAKSALVCEGQIDLITVFESGVKNVIAPQGTAFTDRQARLLKRHAEEAILCFDADAAGQQAAERSFAELLAAGVSVRVATMPPGEDPDSLIRKEGVEVFQEWISTAKDFFDFQIERLSKMFDVSTPRGKAGLCRRLAESVALVSDPLLREAVVGKVTARLGLRAEDFRAVLKAVRPKTAYADRDETPPDLAGAGSEISNSKSEISETPAFEPPRNAAIDLLLTLALRDDQVHAWLLARPDWRERLAAAPGAEMLARVLAAGVRPSEPSAVNAFLATFPPAEEAYLSARRVERAPEGSLTVAEDCWLSLEQQALTARRVELQNRQRAPELTDAEQLTLLKEIVDLQKRLADIARLLSSRRPTG